MSNIKPTDFNRVGPEEITANGVSFLVQAPECPQASKQTPQEIQAMHKAYKSCANLPLHSTESSNAVLRQLQNYHIVQDERVYRKHSVRCWIVSGPPKKLQSRAASSWKATLSSQSRAYCRYSPLPPSGRLRWWYFQVEKSRWSSVQLFSKRWTRSPCSMP